MKKPVNRARALRFFLVAVLVLIDQATKLLALYFLKGRDAFVLIPSVFELQYLPNESAAFGIDPVTILQRIFRFSRFEEDPGAFLAAKMIFFAVLTLAVVVLLFLFLSNIPAERRFLPLILSLDVFAAGAVGNLIDRLFRHYVVDFFYFKLIDFPIFNVADIYVTVSAFFLIILGFFFYKEEDFERIFPGRNANTG